MAFITAETRSSIVELAMGMLNQAPSTALLNTLIAKSVEGASIQDLADYLATTDAFTAEYPATQTAREFATEMFGKLITGGTLDAAINTAVIDLLEGLLIAGTTKAEGFVAVINFLADSANALHPDLGDIAQSFQNRADAAEYFSITKELGGSTAAELAAAIASVTSDAATLTAANKAADATASAEEVVAGQTFTLTTGADIADNISSTRGSLANPFVFTEASDTVNASVSTVNDADILLDSSTTDSDVLNVTGGTGTATIANIETINLTAPVASVLQMDKITGVKSVNLTGTNTITVDGFAASTFQETFGISDITRVVTLKPNVLDGTADLGTAEAINVSVSGLSYGGTTATQSGILVDTTTANSSGVLEVLNIASEGDAANSFSLGFDTGESVATLNVTGSQAATIVGATSQFTGVTVDGSESAGLSLMLDRAGATTTSLNAANFNSVSNIILIDSTPTGTADQASIASMQDGQVVTLGSNFATTNTMTFKGATYTAPKASTTLVLDNIAATPAGITLTSLDIQNVTALNVVSNGHAASTSTTGANVIDSLVGDFSTITITGDTSIEIDLAIEAKQTATSTSARAVTINASGLTGKAFVNFTETAANSKVSYKITGTDNKDSITLNASGGAITAGAGNDVIAGGAGIDTIDLGAGDDTYTVSTGADTLTLGDGKDTVDIDSTGNAAGSEIQTLTVTFGTTGIAAADASMVANVRGEIITWLHDVDQATDVTKAADEMEAALKASDGFLNGDFTITQSSGALTLTFDSDLGNVAAVGLWKVGDDATTSDQTETIGTATNGTIFTNATTTAGVSAADVATEITDFAKGDVLDLAGALTSTAVSYHEGLESGVTGASGDADTIIVLLDPAGFANLAAAEDAYDATAKDSIDGIVVFMNSTLGYAQLAIDNDMGVDGGLADSAVLINFTGITTIAQMAAAFSVDSFTI